MIMTLTFSVTISAVSRNNIPTPTQTRLQTCVAGTVNTEIQSGQTSFDETHEETCAFGHNECYTQSLFINAHGWQGEFKVFCIILKNEKMHHHTIIYALIEKRSILLNWMQ